MPERSICPSTEMANFEPFPEDIAAIETAWGSPIPPDLQLIGGVDEIGYALVSFDETSGMFRGTFLNYRVRYSGDLRYEHPQGNQLPDLDKGCYVISHIDNDQLVMGQDTTTPPRDWFYLVPTDPTAIERP